MPKKNASRTDLKKKKSKPARKAQPIYVEKEQMAKLPAPSIGGSIGGKIGSFIGDTAQKLFKTITGFGDYKVANNSLLLGADSPPMFNSSNGRTVKVKHREFLQDVLGSVAFTNQAVLPINPGLVSTYPWLAQIASNFEEYRLLGMVFEYKTTSAASITSGTNTAMGVVMMATQYNANNAPFGDKQHLENYEFATSCVPSISALHPVECAPNMNALNELYVRSTGQVVTGQDLRLYDLGLFQLSTVGFQSANIVGELWVTYEVEFFKPKLSSALSLQIQEKAAVATASNANPFGGNAGVFSRKGGNIGAPVPSGGTSATPYWVTSTTVNLGVLPVGSYLLMLIWTGGAGAVTSPSSITVSGNSGGANIFVSSSDNNYSMGSTLTDTFFCQLIQLSITSITATGNILTVSGDGVLPTSPSLDLILYGNQYTS